METATPNQPKGYKMYFNNSDIKNDILTHWEQLKDSPYPEDLLTELAESACPVYYSDIIKDWQEMPSEFNDSWQDNGIPTTEQTTIFGLMGWDLYFYYENQYQTIFTEIRLDKEQEQAELENA
jgi:hypothetical protein